MYSGGILLEFLNMGSSEIILILVAALLLFGGKKLPELARGLGKGLREFKDASESVKREIHKNINAVDIDREIAETDARDARRNQTFHPTDEPVVSENSDVKDNEKSSA